MIELIKYYDYIDRHNKRKKLWAVNYDKHEREEIDRLVSHNGK